MAQRWRILRRPFKAKEENTRYIILACLKLHNFLIKESSSSRSTYCPPGTADHIDWEGRIVDGSWRAEDDGSSALCALPNKGGNSTRLAYDVRDRLCRYLISDGKVPW
ncbi:hypothetical protein V5799_007196 [Amblyomma americanum]|uniref:Nuclease harbi1-like protein n=1 Tax=Amblyomma americanum TaxID=6943 RepID=A0AAQ4DU84_AMBAM